MRKLMSKLLWLPRELRLYGSIYRAKINEPVGPHS